MATSKAQTEANKRYKAKNKEKVKYWQTKSMAKKFVLDLATKEDLLVIEKIIKERLLTPEEQQDNK